MTLSRSAVVFVASTLLLSLLSVDAQPPPIGTIDVNTPLGKIRGLTFDYGNDTTQLLCGRGDVFLNIPYVKPPINDLRFKHPVPLDNLTLNSQGYFDATTYGPACPQLPGATGPANISEDCLQVNVFTPNASTIYKYPVMVWIHGGAMVNGYAEQYTHMGAIRNLVRHGVVVVTLQYRIGLLGFFTTFTDDFPPNLGMLDQVEALRWVQKYIVHFGGDPYRVTIFGQSSGAASVSAHTLSPLSRGLFQQAILESGSVQTSLEGALGFSGLSQNRALQLCNFNTSSWNSRNYQPLKDCLSKMDYKDWLDAEVFNFFGWKMTQDNYFLPGVPRDLQAQRPNLPILIGSAKNEFTFFMMELILAGAMNTNRSNEAGFDSVFSLVGGYLGPLEQNVSSILKSVYRYNVFQTDDDHLDWVKTMDLAFTSAGFTGFITTEVDFYLRAGNKQVYVYEFNYPSDLLRLVEIPGWKPVFHCSDLPFVWYYWKQFTSNATVPQDRVVAEWVGIHWTNFAKYGTPDPTGASGWPRAATPEAVEYIEIDGQTNPPKAPYRRTDQLLWQRIMPPIIGVYPPDVPDYNNGTTVTDPTPPEEAPLEASAKLLKKRKE